jgi:metal-responsive CopG/Arc/MetJ family transcriptional regulator
MGKIKNQLGTITIMLGDRNAHAQDVNRLLSEAGDLIIARLGVNVERTHVDHCSALITVVVEGGKKEITDLTKKLDKLYGVVAKSSIVTEK